LASGDTWVCTMEYILLHKCLAGRNRLLDMFTVISFANQRPPSLASQVQMLVRLRDGGCRKRLIAWEGVEGVGEW